eukprot:CAMPEP_0185725648 /NCGR_PEP_ID=MMETSP1171-20130828/1856_1 /TAXON_ID=374046 /ORGANISM="Helicotheca tamensis, Strain CCMP826" /LENGTH=230 /DNA_ID=CAMNT_0028393827 /DNA_START=90 /DNA_END=782 /DNA_ORIENTATION=+
MKRGVPEPDRRPPLTAEEFEDAKELVYRHFLENDVNVKDLTEAGMGIKRTANEEEIEVLQYSIQTLQAALERTPEVSPEDDEPNYPPAEERYAARAKNAAYRRGELGVVDATERAEFENAAKFTPAEKKSAIKFRDEKVTLYRESREGLKKHESGEEKLSEEDFERYTEVVNAVKAELEAHMKAAMQKSRGGGQGPRAKVPPRPNAGVSPNAGQMPTTAKQNPHAATGEL